MLEFDIDKMLFTIPPDMHTKEDIGSLLEDHPEVQFVSMVGIDMGGHASELRQVPQEEIPEESSDSISLTR